jgi:hypothetical protein
MLRSDKSPAGICQSHPRINLLRHRREFSVIAISLLGNNGFWEASNYEFCQLSFFSFQQFAFALNLINRLSTILFVMFKKPFVSEVIISSQETLILLGFNHNTRTNFRTHCHPVHLWLELSDGVKG